jgi:hypothetical protein
VKVVDISAPDLRSGIVFLRSALRQFAGKKRTPADMAGVFLDH